MTILSGRIKNKLFTENEWLVADPQLLKGELIFVKDGEDVKMKVSLIDGARFSETEYSSLSKVEIRELILNGAVGFNPTVVGSGGTLPATTTKEFMFVGPGTFNKPGGGTIVTTENLNVLSSDGATWVLSKSVPVTVPPPKIPAWQAQVYTAGLQVNRNGNFYEAVVNTTAGQEPGIVPETIWKRVNLPSAAVAVKSYKTGDQAKNAAGEILVAIKDAAIADTAQTTGTFMKQGLSVSNIYNIENYYGR
ncbi:hypothetical protein [Desertivirga xinjiangensis]|uniref:hypothetical protein n=1 Tax=Desertivirga xinjiangensis TaxID=539206 RepID=UPI00210E6C20|nr:hypothetical protein [Pedobacter xinjiangensis]